MLNNLDTNDDGDDGNNHDGLDNAMIFISPSFLAPYFICVFFPVPVLLFPPTYLDFFLLLSMWRVLL